MTNKCYTLNIKSFIKPNTLEITKTNRRVKISNFTAIK